MQNNHFPISFDGFHLKYIALITMTLDHIAYALLQPDTAAYAILRTYGRVSFPIFCFLLTEGYLHTSSHSAYLKRLCFFALISELPFDMAIYHFPLPGSQPAMFFHQNIFFTLALGFLSICLIDRFLISNPLFSLLWTVFSFFIAYHFRFDYGPLGIAVILLFYAAKKVYPNIPRGWSYTLALLPLITVGNWEKIFSLLSLPLLLLYNGQKGKPLVGNKKLPGGKYFFYWYYPCHLLFLAIFYTLFA